MSTSSTPPTQPRNNWRHWLIVAGVLLAIIALVQWIGGDDDPAPVAQIDDSSDVRQGPGGSVDEPPGKLEQTWSQDYADTTCAEWAGQMDNHQRFVAAADMLTGARNKHGGSGLPPDSLIETFQSGISNVCTAEESLGITDAAVGLYLTERARFAP